MDFLNNSSSRSSEASDDCLNVETSNNLIDVNIDETEVIDMDVDSDSDHGGDVASLSSFYDSDNVSVTSETQDVPEENEEVFEENDAEVLSNPSLFGSDRGSVASNAEIADLLVVFDDDANIRADYEELEENQEDDEFEGNQEDDELEGNQEDDELEGNQEDDDLEGIQEDDELEGNQEELASIDLLASEASSGSIVVIDLDDSDVEAMVEDVDEVIVGGDEEVMIVEDDEINSNSQLFPTASVASSESSTQAVLDDHLLQEHNYRIALEQLRLRELRREEAEIQAQLDEQLSVDQHTGYGIVQGNLDVFRDIEGVLPKLPSIQLTFNWLTNVENNFNLFI